MIRIITVIMACLIVAGCDVSIENFDLVEKGRSTYLVNKTLGDVYLVDDANLIKLTEVNAKKEQFGRVLRDEFTISDDRIDLDIKVKLLSDRALYVMKITPAIKPEKQEDGTIKQIEVDFQWLLDLVKKHDSYKSITLYFKDSDGFKYLEKEIKINSGPVRSLNGAGKVAQLTYQGKISLSPEIIQNLSAIDVVWNF